MEEPPWEGQGLLWGWLLEAHGLPAPLPQPGIAGPGPGPGAFIVFRSGPSQGGGNTAFPWCLARRPPTLPPPRALLAAAEVPGTAYPKHTLCIAQTLRTPHPAGK